MKSEIKIGADAIAKKLETLGVECIFEYPGGCTVFMLDAIKRLTDIRIVTCRHEQGAVFAASGYAKSSGKVGVCMATSGPGATNLITGIADAQFDYTPLVAITGQVPTYLYKGSGERQTGFQEIDIVSMVEPITVYAYTAYEDNYLEVIRKAFFFAKVFNGASLVDMPIDIQRIEI